MLATNEVNEQNVMVKKEGKKMCILSASKEAQRHLSKYCTAYLPPTKIDIFGCFMLTKKIV